MRAITSSCLGATDASNLNRDVGVCVRARACVHARACGHARACVRVTVRASVMCLTEDEEQHNYDHGHDYDHGEQDEEEDDQLGD